VQTDGAGWKVTVPHYRHDLSLEVDLIEEVARIHGYRRIPERRLAGRIGMHAAHDTQLRAWRRLLAARGYYEAITWSFVDAALQSRLCGGQPAIALANPIASDQGVMRLSLWPGLLQALRGNLARQQDRVRLFEVGRVYLPGARGRPGEPSRVAGLVSGNSYPKQWDMKDRAGDFFDVKGDVEALLESARLPNGVDWLPTEHAALQPGQAAEVQYKNQRLGVIGTLHPGLLQGLDIEQPVVGFELEIDRLPPPAAVVFQAPSRYPAMRRDVALEVARSLPAGDLVRGVRTAAGPLLGNLELFDVYQGEGIDLGKKSLALCLTFQKTSSTLIEEEIEDELNKILNFLREKFGASLRS
jgi:phenylalanyl-tRNA synthetase beta chain